VNTNLSTALKLAQKANQLSKKLNYEYGFAMSQIPYAHCLLNFSKTSEAQKAVMESLAIFRKIKYAKGEALAQIYYSAALSEFGFFLKAFSELEQSLDIFLSIGEPRGISLAYKNLGRLCFEIEDYDSAIEYSHKSLSYSNANYSNCRINNNLGHFHFHKKEYDKSIVFLNKGLYEAGLVNDKYCVSTVLINLGNVFNAKNEKSKAASYYEHGLTFLRQFGLPLEAFSSLNNLANIQIETRKYEDALGTLKKLREVAAESNNRYLVNETSIKIASTLKLLNRSTESLQLLNSVAQNLKKEENHELNYKCHNVLANIFEEKENHHEALKHYKIYSKEREEFLNNKMTEKLSFMNSKSQIDGYLSQRNIQKQKDIEIATVYDELVDFTEKLDSAEITISNLTKQIEFWQGIIPLCDTCKNLEIEAESLSKIKYNIEENPYLFQQNSSCIFCFKQITSETIYQNDILQISDEIYV
jgi:tetratricopeptide (TPR) repeat protein